MTLSLLASSLFARSLRSYLALLLSHSSAVSPSLLPPSLSLRSMSRDPSSTLAMTSLRRRTLCVYAVNAAGKLLALSRRTADWAR